jgi:hypothetical protein
MNGLGWGGEKSYREAALVARWDVYVNASTRSHNILNVPPTIILPPLMSTIIFVVVVVCCCVLCVLCYALFCRYTGYTERFTAEHIDDIYRKAKEAVQGRYMHGVFISVVLSFFFVDMDP